ncbi:MAG: DUF262 domain-containing protein [Chloroflexi bacterium]|nr:DUF262 domain-containing protein [Chloroflexota bacterium]
MAYESVKIRELVDRAVTHAWSIPEFQRGFVWKTTQVRDLAESLWLDYPIGSLLVWNSQDHAEERVVTDAQRPNLWVVDGQQRVTALCILFGRKPYWWQSGEEWERMVKKYDIRFDINAKEPPYFRVANAAIRKVKEDRYIPLSKLLVLDVEKPKDQQELQRLAKEIKQQGLCGGMDAMEVYTRLDRIRKIREKDVVTVAIDQELEDVVEIFSRLNSRGTRVTEADIYLGVVATRNPGWVRSAFLPYVRKLADAGFDMSPNLLFRTLTGVGAKKVRFREIPKGFWNQESIHPYWDRTKAAWQSTIQRFREYGILSNDPMPTEAALVPMVALADKFPHEKFELPLYWFLQASRFSRYSGSGTTSLEEDLRDIQEADSLDGAVRRLLRRFAHTTPIEAEDFMRDYGDSRFGRFLLYLLAYRNKAQDWDDSGQRLGFEGMELLVDFRPQWHHVFPKAYLQSHKVSDDLIDALANIAVIGPTINIRISAKEPMNYIQRYGITAEKLAQQYIEDGVVKLSVSNFEDWLNRRAQTLADAGNAFLDELKGGL